MRRKIMAFVLCLAMLTSMLVPGTLATSAASESSTTQIEVVNQDPTETITPTEIEGSEPTMTPTTQPCTICGVTDCTSTHESWCAECQKDDCGVDHTTVPAVENCEHCGVELTEGAVHADDCLSKCTCTPVEGVHNNGCVFAPVVESTGPQMGDKIWINANSVVYKNIGDTEGHTLLGNYEVKITSIVDGEWYEFAFTSLGVGEVVLQVGGYKYVRAENTSVKEPVTDEHACNCGENAPENLAKHADSCPRKTYIKTMFEGKTAEEIYAQWENYDEATQNDLLNMLQVYDTAKYEALNQLIDGSEKETTVGEVSLKVQGIPENVQISVNKVIENEYHEGLSEFVDQSSELLYAYDITLTNPDGSVWQPNEGKTATVTLDFNGAGLPDGNTIKVLHEHNDELNYLGEYGIEDGKLTFTTDGFSKFYFYITYTFGGHGFTMSGGSTVYLSEILQELAISRSVSEVTDVRCTNPDILSITRVGGDWKLESLSPFGSEETLTIVFSDGETIDILVKDPVVYNYAVGSDITNVTVEGTKTITMGTITNGDTSAQGKTYKTNSVVITKDELHEAAGAADSVSVIVYAEPGMAIGFESGTTWAQTDGSRPTAEESGIWFWCWDGTVNYAIVKENTAGKQVTFQISAVLKNKNVTVAVTICSVANSTPTKLIDALPSGYSIKNVPVTLYNYDGAKFDGVYNSQEGNYIAFTGTAGGVRVNDYATNRGWITTGTQANGSGGNAKMGIMKDTLENGLPVTSQGQKVDFFSATNSEGKTVYPNTNFQFVYNEETGYYSYNSTLNHAQYNEATGTIELYQQSLAISDTPNGTDKGNAGFYPFEDITKAYTNTGYTTAMTQQEWLDALENEAFELIPSQYSSDIVVSGSTDPASTADMHFGIQLASDFYMPEDKKLNGQDMVYEFTGDDDLWVFIDGKLVLDIGGGHTHVSGSVNLTTGKVWVEKYAQLSADDGGSYEVTKQGQNLEYTDSFLTGLQDDQMHTIQIFYLERFSGVSNCLMRFNLPLVPSDAVNVSKNLVNQDGDDLSVTPDVDYTFTLYTATDNDDNVNATDFTALANAEYTVTGSGAPSGTQITNADGQFTLKDGWIASFSGIARFTEVYVVESSPNDVYQYVSSTVSVNKGEAVQYKYGQKTDTKVMQLNSSINFDFVNKMQTWPLTVEKQVVNDTEGLLDESQQFKFTLDFTKTILETGEGAISATKASYTVALTDGDTFALKHGESITIPRVPVNMTYTVKETNPDSINNSFDAPVFTATQSTSTAATVPTAFAFDTAYEWKMTDGAENMIAVTNQQRFNLTISKSGIDSTDHHTATASEKEERQSTIFEVTGPNDFKMQVAICGNDSVTIMALPVGQYKVRELDDWSWRYEVKSGTTVSRDVDPDKYNVIVDYENTREEIYWLSGDSYAENWWGGNSGQKVTRKDED